MKTTLTADATRTIESRLREANQRYATAYPGEPEGRQPVHTVYGGAQLFRHDAAKKLGTGALRAMADHAPDFVTFARALGLPGSASLPTEIDAIADLQRALARDPDLVRAAHPQAWLAHTIHGRVIAKLEREAVEDFRIDFEDGFGTRPDAEEDETAVRDAHEVAKGLSEGTLPPFIGIRIKSLAEETRIRALRTLDLFVTSLVQATGGKLPPNFVVTIPKVTIPEHVAATVEVFELLERGLGLPSGALKMEIMVEMTQSIIDESGNINLPLLLRAGRGRIIGAHFGTYDYTAGCNITAAWQTMTHPACSFARHAMQVSFARTGIFLSDGATNVMPVPVHRQEGDKALTLAEQVENRQSVHAAWKLQYDHVQDSLMRGFYQGWDLHPGQLPVRYASIYTFFLRGFDAAADRLKNFVAKAAQATLLGDVFDDAATGQGLLNYFLRAINCGAVSEEEALRRTGLTLEEVQLRSFAKILELRRKA
ncbi:MAG: phosphoenolpyruvate kinase [Polyangiaceae bacterium]|nr:phosphoenolpyruvate kinase [Polyangiaceae bacterium]